MKTLGARRFLCAVVFLVACSGSVSEQSPGPVATSADVADLARDPAVVATDLDGPVSCAGARVAADVVPTARRCVSYPDPDAELAQANPERRIVGAAREKKGPVDMGAHCTFGVECAAGICVTEATRRYCSRSCSPHDHCPAHFRCETSAQGSPVCVAD